MAHNWTKQATVTLFDYNMSYHSVDPKSYCQLKPSLNLSDSQQVTIPKAGRRTITDYFKFYSLVLRP